MIHYIRERVSTKKRRGGRKGEGRWPQWDWEERKPQRQHQGGLALPPSPRGPDCSSLWGCTEEISFEKMWCDHGHGFPQGSSELSHEYACCDKVRSTRFKARVCFWVTVWPWASRLLLWASVFSPVEERWSPGSFRALTFCDFGRLEMMLQQRAL